MNLRKDHYRVHARKGRPPTLVYYYFVALASCLRALYARQRIPKLFLLMSSEYYIIVKTFNNGSLGSGIDEERSEMR